MTKDGEATSELEPIRERLRRAQGREYWRGLDDLTNTAEFQRILQEEFPGFAEGWAGGINRRDALKLMGASLALAGLSACTSRPVEKIVPYVHAPAQFVPGEPLYYATAMTLGGYAKGLLVESHLGRPTKVEGNPQHPASLGATDAYSQASILTLYDPDRAQAVTKGGRITGWSAFLKAMSVMAEEQHLTGGAGFCILTGTITSPALAAQIQAVMDAFPKAQWFQYEPVANNAAWAGSHLAFGEYVSTYYRMENADVILALDSDFLCSGPAGLRYAREWAARRRAPDGNRQMNRLYAVESMPSGTGAVADHRFPLRAADIETFARIIAKEIGLPVDAPDQSPVPSQWRAALVRDLKAHQGSSLVTAGTCLSAATQSLVHAMNHALGGEGNTVIHTEPVEVRPTDQIQSLRELVERMRSGDVSLLLILSGNPVFDAPSDLDFGAALVRVKSSIHLGLYHDETSSFCDWHIPEAHYLESWGDARAYDGTVSIIQPLIAPLYAGKTAHELLSVFQQQPDRSGYDAVRNYWKTRIAAKDFDEFWQTSLNEGLVAASAFPPKAVQLKSTPTPSVSVSSSPGLEICFRPDPSVFDGRFANNGWLQELPKPLTKLTWDNAALLSPATAGRLGLNSGDIVELEFQGHSVRAPVWTMPGHAPDSVTVHFGHGRTRAGKVGTGTGFNAYALRSSIAPWNGMGLVLHRTGSRMVLASTELHHSMEGRNLVRVGTIGEFKKNPKFVHEMGETPPADLTLYPEFDYAKGYQWGMVVNLGACIGCNACVAACEAENNSPIVGKAQVANAREMQWLRIDRYYHGQPDDPSMTFSPVLCMHCENAPCELVCPVQATNHSSEGLNQMVYNRCVGTRYCSNNCPYKVRRFNFFQYTDWDTPSLKSMRNPDVSVRGRGVMEKCSYCIQRIQEAKIRAEKQDREIRDGEVVTACQQACPTQAFTFGNINDPNSRVAGLKRDPLNYAMLAELNVRPRTTYLARLHNPNPEIGKE